MYRLSIIILCLYYDSPHSHFIAMAKITTHSVCVISIDDWLDSVNEPMPWLSTATYQAGESITLGVELKSHHLGHMEVRGCPVAADDATNGRASVTQDCFDAHVLEFIEDVSYQMPKGTLL